MAGLSRSDEERMAASYARNHHVSREHLDRYLAEFDFRHSTCETTDTERVNMLVDRVGGRRLTYRQPAQT